MTTNVAHTSQDNTELRQLLAQREAEIARQSAELLARDLLIEKLKLQLSHLRRHRFGAKSEALDKIINQLEQAEKTAPHSRADAPDLDPAAKQQPTRKPLPDHLPREDIVLHPGETCEQCGGALRHLGEDVTETLEYVPGRFKVIRTVRPKLSCRCCEAIHQVPISRIERIRRSLHQQSVASPLASPLSVLLQSGPPIYMWGLIVTPACRYAQRTVHSSR